MGKMATDPYTLEIIKNALTAIGDEMFTVMARASMSPIIYEALDYSVGLTDSSGELIAQGNGTTVFLGMIDSLVKDVLSKFGDEGAIAPGDVFLSNDPYGGGANIPLHYQTREKGSNFLLYSLGPDLKDDGGQPQKNPYNTVPGDMVAGKLWYRAPSNAQSAPTSQPPSNQSASGKGN